MEWGKLKTVLICLFIAVNIFLGVILHLQHTRKYSISADLVEDVISVLATKQVQLEQNMISPKRISLRGYLFLTTEEQEDLAAKRIMGSFIKNEKESIYINGENLLSFSSQSRISFTGLWKYYRYQYSAKGVQEAVEFFLQDLCDNSLSLIKRGVELDPANQVYKVTYGQEIEGIDITDTNITVWANREGIIKAEGTVIYTPCYSYEKGQLSDSFNSLLKYAMLEEIQNSDSMVKISKVQPVYTIGQKNTASVLYACWEISALGKEVVRFNAITGERIK
jgi:hypothetical protein